MGNNENNIGQTVYEQLQEMVDECIKLGYSNGKYKSVKFIDEESIVFYRNETTITDYLSYHWLFSKDSGIMERVEWDVNGKNILLDYEFIEDGEGNPGIDAKQSYDDDDVGYHYCNMSMLTAEQKMKYFLSNAKLSTKSE